MAERPADLLVQRCAHCQGRFLPRPGACPRCGSRELVEDGIPAAGVVLAATELLAPAAGWPAPHRIAIVEAAEQVRVLGVVRGAVPAPGDRLTIRRSGEIYELSAEASVRPPA
ncbi:MAG TPA: zinc ribbon domain-containing protein [Thermoplasmata archaeon]|nr:zinc ribbon domain-containing protein [Thermoplasmata archaeon]